MTKPPSDTSPVSHLIDYTRQIWLAGLGAFAAAEREGSHFFETLVKRGEQVEAEFKKTTENKIEALRSKAEAARYKANDTWNHLEQVFQKRVARALTRLGVPSAEDLQALTRQAEALHATVQALLHTEPTKAPRPQKTKTPDTASAQ